MIVSIVWFALNPLASGILQIGNLVAFIEYRFHALFSFLLFANLFTMYPRMVVSSERISEVMNMPISINPNEDGVTETQTKGYLEFDKVTFAYPGETESPVLKDISFKAKPGETIAFIGSTGSGKSTLVNSILANELLARLHRAQTVSGTHESIEGIEKINKVIEGLIPGGASETLLVIDATTGQNGISQAKAFKEITNITGIVLTKLDGTAKGGIVLAIKEEVGLPVKYIGLGETKDDLQVFDIEKYIYGLFKDMM